MGIDAPGTREQMERAIGRYWLGGTLRDIADELGVSTSTVQRWLRAAGMDMRPANAQPRLRPGIGIAEARERAAAIYLGGGTTRDIADELGVVPTTAWRWLREAGVELRPKGQRPRLDRDAITAMRASGMSWRRIGARIGTSPGAARRAWLAGQDG